MDKCPFFSNNSLDNLIKDLRENAYELNDKIVDLVKKKGFFPHSYWNSFQKFKESLPRKDKCYI